MKQKLTVLVAVFIALTACNKEDGTSSGVAGPIAFDTYAEGLTRTVALTTSNLSTFGAAAYTGSVEIMNNQLVEGGNGAWSYSPIKYWPQSGALYFSAYAPYATASNGITPSYNTSTRSFNLTYVMPADEADQVDLLMAQNVDVEDCSNRPAKVQFTFGHILSRIGLTARYKGNVSAGTTVTLTDVKVSGKFMASGDYTVSGGWSNQVASASTVIYDRPAAKLAVTALTTTAQGLLAGDNYVMVIPNGSVAMEGTITVSYTVRTSDGVEIQYVKDASSSLEYEPNKTYLYNLIIDLDSDIIEFGDVTVLDWGETIEEDINIPAPLPVITTAIPTFRGYVLSKGILSQNGESMSLTTGSDPFESLGYYETEDLTSTNRHYFTWDELKTYFDGVINDDAFNYSVHQVSQDAAMWIVPTSSDWETMKGTSDASKGAFVNGSSVRSHYALVMVDLSGSPYASFNGGMAFGMILFPDDAVVTLSSLTSCDNEDGSENNLTYAEVCELVAGGAMFFPTGGLYSDDSWQDGGFLGDFWTATHRSSNEITNFIVAPDYVGLDKEGRTSYLQVKLIQEPERPSIITTRDPHVRGYLMSKGILSIDSGSFRATSGADPFELLGYFGTEDPTGTTKHYISWKEMKVFFDGTLSETSFNYSVSKINHDGKTWVVPSSSDWSNILSSSDATQGAFVNGSATRSHYAFITADLSGSAYEEVNGGSVQGLLLFPDDADVTLPSLTSCDNADASENTVSHTDVKALVDGGASFIPFVGGYLEDWIPFAFGGLWWASTYEDSDTSKGITFTSTGFTNPESVGNEAGLPVKLVQG